MVPDRFVGLLPLNIRPETDGLVCSTDTLVPLETPWIRKDTVVTPKATTAPANVEAALVGNLFIERLRGKIIAANSAPRTFAFKGFELFLGYLLPTGFVIPSGIDGGDSGGGGGFIDGGGHFSFSAIWKGEAYFF
jgi:hypothetical protein